MGERPSSPDPAERWTPHLGGERVVEGIHYGWLMKDHLARYQYAAPVCRGKRILDVATGSGYGANILRANGAANVVAVDREQAALDYAADRYGTDRIEWVNADAYELPFDGEFDVVVSFETIEHVKEPGRFVQQCKKAMKADGVYVVSTPENVGGPFVSPYHELEFNRHEFQELLERHFGSVELLGQRRELALPIRLLGNLPDRYWRSIVERGRGSHRLYRVMDRVNKAPNYALAHIAGMADSWRERIVPLDEKIRLSMLLQDHYYVMIAVCRQPTTTAEL